MFFLIEIINLRNSYESRTDPELPSPEQETTEPFSVDTDFHMDISQLNKLNKLSDLTINEHISDEELVNMYKDSDILEEQADILHYLFYNKFDFILRLIN